MSLSRGTRLGHYHVTALLGEGGMGQVWQATDTQLNRQVALKILPDAFAADPDRLARFKREAQVLASLNHPNIAAIYGIEPGDDTRALVLELVEGPTLADRIAKGPIPLTEALPIAKQITEALEAAHEAGVVHRDLKPANIKVREDGTVKVLDFGLAKATEPSPAGDPSQSPTLTAAATQMGVIVGTAAYMSPEQASGGAADKRADIWSFGVVLFEMLTGRRAFDGETVSPLPMPPGPYYSPRLSPDGNQVAVEMLEDVWIYDVASGRPTKLTFHPAIDRSPVWTPRGESIAFTSNRDGRLDDVFMKLAAGTGQAQLLVSDPTRQLFPGSWTQDGLRLLVHTLPMGDIGIVTVGDLTLQPVLDEVFNVSTPEVSPNGQWMAYASDQTGQSEVYVVPFPDVSGGGPWQVSTDGGAAPAWSVDGLELFYQTLDGTALMAVTVETEPTFRRGIPAIRLEGDYVTETASRHWDIARDKRFLMLKNANPIGTADAPPPQINVVLNWHEELARLVPTN